MGLLSIFKRHEQPDKLKSEIEKNKELVLDVMSESIKDARICPIIQKKCIGKFCEFMLEFKDQEGKAFSRCAYVAAPLLTLETKLEVERLQHIVLSIVEASQGIKK